MATGDGEGDEVGGGRRISNRQDSLHLLEDSFHLNFSELIKKYKNLVNNQALLQVDLLF